MSLDQHYVNPRLVELYDLDSGWSEDRDYYLSLADGPGKRVLDLGCGTGLLCNAYAKNGHDTTGVDPSEHMLEAGRNKSHGDKIEWVLATSQDFKSDKQFDLIIMTGHAFQVLLTQEDVLETFKTMKDHIKSGGTIAFESRNPQIDWKRIWDYELELETPNCKVTESRRFLSMHEGRMKFGLTYQFPQETLTSTSELRFFSLKEIEYLLRVAGLSIKNLYGDWNKSNFVQSTSEEMIFEVEKIGG